MENDTTNEEKAIVEIQILEANKSGLQVKMLETGKIGFVPRQEVTRERRVSIPIDLPEPGTIVRAVFLDKEIRGMPVFSLRLVYDPWRNIPKIKKQYEVGQTVICEVVSVRNSWASVQLEPGIDGLIYPREVSFARGQNIEDVLWVGDKVEAEITRIDIGKRVIELSITRAQHRKSFPKSVDEQANELLEMFGRNESLFIDKKTNNAIVKTTYQKISSPQEISKLSRILIIDDEIEWQDRIKLSLEKAFEVGVFVASDRQEGMKKLEQGTPYDLILIDVDLGEDSGVELAQDIRENKPNLPILLISTAPLSSVQNQYSSHILTEEFTFSQKETEVILICKKIQEMMSGLEQTAQRPALRAGRWVNAAPRTRSVPACRRRQCRPGLADYSRG